MNSPLAVSVNRGGFGAYMDARGIAALKRYRSGLGDVTQTGQLVSKGVSLGAGIGATAAITAGVTAIGGAAAGAALGSVVPIVGTIIGAAVGFLTSKLFGHANYAAVYQDANNVQQLFLAYRAVAGQYPGRVYGWPEIQYVYHGAMIWGLFTGNGPSTPGTCTQAMIANKINACGTGQWIDDLIGAGAPQPGSGSNNIRNLVGSAIAAGVTNPVQIAQQYLIPGLEAVAKGKNNSWISIAGSRNPQLYTQMLIDIADVIVTTQNPNTPVYYGVLPPGYGGASSTAAVAAAATAPVGSPAAAAQPAPPALSPGGTSIKAGTAGTMITTQGTWVFSSNTNASGSLLLLNGQSMNAYGVLFTLTNTGQLLLTDAANNVYQWQNGVWSTLTTSNTGSASANPASAAALSAAGSKITPTSGGSLVTSAGTWTFGNSNDGVGNYQVLLNGSAASAGNSNATQLQVGSNGVVVATVSNGATYQWGASGWTTLSGPTSSIAVSTPSAVSPNGATIQPGTGSQLITAQGEWTFSTQQDGTGNYYLLLNGTLAGSESGVALSILNSSPTLMRNDGSTWVWGGTSWAQVTAATSAPGGQAVSLVSSALMGTPPTSDAASYDGGPLPDGLGSSSYSAGYSASPTSPTPAVPVAASGMSSTEKLIIFGGVGLGALLLFFKSRHGSVR